MFLDLYRALAVEPALPSPSWGWRQGGAGCVRECPTLYRPRHAESTDLYRLIEDHFEEYESHVYHVIPGSDPPTSAPVLEGAVDQFTVRVFPNPSSGTVRA